MLQSVAYDLSNKTNLQIIKGTRLRDISSKRLQKVSLGRIRLPPLKMSDPMSFEIDVFVKVAPLLSTLSYDYNLPKIPRGSVYCRNHGSTKNARQESINGVRYIVFDLAPKTTYTTRCAEVLWCEIIIHAKVLHAVETHRKIFGLTLKIPRLYLSGTNYVVDEIVEMRDHEKFGTENVFMSFGREFGAFIGLMIWYLKIEPLDFESCLSEDTLYIIDFGNFSKILRDFSFEDILEMYKFSILKSSDFKIGLKETYDYFHKSH